MLSSRASNSMPFLLLQLLLFFWCMQKVTRSPLPLPIQGPSSASSFAVFSSCLAALLCVSAAVDLSKKTFSTDDHLISYIRPPLFASCRHSIAFVNALDANLAPSVETLLLFYAYGRILSSTHSFQSATMEERKTTIKLN